MGDVISFLPPGADDPAGALSAFVAFARDTLKIYEDQGGFGAHQWHYVDETGRKHAMRFAIWSPVNNSYAFTPFEEPFLSFAKAYVRYRQDKQEVTTVGNKTAVLAAAYDALTQLGRSLTILALDGAVMVRTEALIRDRYAAARCYHLGDQLEMLADFVRHTGICPSLPCYESPFTRQRHRAQGTTAEDKAWQEARCPSMHQMLALADIFRLAKEERDQYWSSVIVLLMFAPSRGSELAFLVVDSLIEEDGQWYVLWYAKKKKDWTKKPVDPVLVPAVKEAFARLIRIGAKAREAAKYAYENPGKFQRHAGCITPPDFGEDEPLNALQFACAMNRAESVIDQLRARASAGLSPDDDAAWSMTGGKTKLVAALRASGPVTYRKLAEHVAKTYCGHGWPNIPKSQRPVWDSLILIRDDQFHAQYNGPPFSWVIPTVNQLNDQLGGRVTTYRIQTIFDRFCRVDEDGKTPIEITSHQIRVWLSTWANKNGMGAWQLAQWAGRAHIADNEAYQIRTQREKSERAKAVLALKKEPMALEAVRLNLPVTYETLGIDRPGVAHATLYGFCVRDWAMAPCIKGGGEACASCDDHKCIKGLEGNLKNYIELEAGLTRELARAALHLDAKTFGANNWYRFLGFRLAKIKALIAQLTNPETPDGAVLGVPKGFDPSPLQRARAQVVPLAIAEAQESLQRMGKKFIGWGRRA